MIAQNDYDNLTQQITQLTHHVFNSNTEKITVEQKEIFDNEKELIRLQMRNLENNILSIQREMLYTKLEYIDAIYA